MAALVNLTSVHVDNGEFDIWRSRGALSVKIDDFERFSKPEDMIKYVDGNHVYVRDIAWNLCVKNVEVNGVQCLSVLLNSDLAGASANFECNVRATITISREWYENDTNKADLSYNMVHKYTYGNNLGPGKLVSRIDELLNPDNGFLYNGALCVNVVFSVDKPRGQIWRDIKVYDPLTLDEAKAEIVRLKGEIEDKNYKLNALQVDNETKDKKIEKLNTSLVSLIEALKC